MNLTLSEDQRAFFAGAGNKDQVTVKKGRKLNQKSKYISRKNSLQEYYLSKKKLFHFPPLRRISLGAGDFLARSIQSR
jgi:hypothetical protein